jgi:precorrin-6Y C5,15-methyltransferase (decarboxylating)
MKTVTVVGAGLGKGTLTLDALDAIGRADALIGAPRLLELCKDFGVKSYPCYLPKDIAAVVSKEDACEFVILVSGDVGFYSAAKGLSEELTEYELRFIPGISSVNAFFAKLKLPWQDASLISAHGRSANIVEQVRRNRLTFCLSGNNADELGTALNNAGFGHIKTLVGENLETEDERICETLAKELTKREFPPMIVLLFINDMFDDRTPYGLPDGRFLRVSDVPMTKSETRAIVMSKLNLHPDSVCWDVGAGSGSTTVEMALSAYRGHVFAVERGNEASDLIRQNRASFHLGNVTVIHGSAPSMLKSLPSPDAVFIGGSGGDLGGIITEVLRKNPNARIVVTAVSIETMSATVDALEAARLEPEITQVSIARTKRVGGYHMFEAQNPVTVISAGGNQ